jgi:stearoyl-CoA desaturase (delta-9 desaturase)
MSTPGEAISTEVRDSRDADGLWARQEVISRALYWGIHAACLLAFWTGVSTGDFLLFLTTVTIRMFGITAGYHRYFSHRTFRTSRIFQFVLALMGASATQKGPLWWSATHRLHHRYSDQPGDPHSPKQGFWYSHQGWIFDGRWDATDMEQVRDLARYPELGWLNRWHIVPPAALAVICFWIGGLSGLVWGFAISTTVAWHTTYAINSLTHRFGRRRFETGDDSRNSFLLALLTLGEGWHNNHHYYQSCTRQGFFWWELDVTYYLLRGLQALGLVWDIREPPARVYAEALARGGVGSRS